MGAGDFYPALDGQTSYVVRAFDAGVSCKNGTDASTCVSVLKGVSEPSSLPLLLPKSDMTNVTGGTDFAPVVTTVWPLCASGWVLLGDLTKYVAASTVRFPSVICTAHGISFSVAGSAHEKVPLTLLRPRGANSAEVLAVDVTIPGAGLAHYRFGTNAETQLLF